MNWHLPDSIVELQLTNQQTSFQGCIFSTSNITFYEDYIQVVPYSSQNFKPSMMKLKTKQISNNMYNSYTIEMLRNPIIRYDWIHVQVSALYSTFII